MIQILNDRERDQLFLKACFEENESALNQWNTDSYWTEVAMAIKTVLNKNASGLFSREWMENLIVDCTSAIYEQHSTFPSRFLSLKTRVQRFAFAYAAKYLKEYLNTKPL